MEQGNDGTLKLSSFQSNITEWLLKCKRLKKQQIHLLNIQYKILNNFYQTTDNFFL